MLRFFFVLMLFSIPAYAAPSWQQSSSHSVQLGIRDKFGDMRAYTAQFVVYGPGKEYKLTQHVKQDSWGYVYFPQDFTAISTPGHYTWQCMVNNKIVGNGEFDVAKE